MKKLLLCSLSLLLLLSPLAAGGDKESSAEKSGRTVIHFYDWAPTDTSIIDDFNAANPDVYVEFHSIPDNGGDKLVQLDILAMGGGEIDVMPGSDGEQMVRMKNGIYAPLDAFIERDGIDMAASFGDVLSYASYNGVTYGYPFRSTVEGIWYNKDLFDEAGIPYPDGSWTWDEYKEIAQKLTKGTGSGKVYGTYTHVFNGQWAPVANEVAPWYGEDGLSNINSEAFRTQLERRKELDDLGYQLSYSQIQATKATQAAYFLGGKCAMVQAGSWLLQNIKDQENYPHTFRIGVAPLPRYDESVESTNNFTVAASILAIPANSKHKEEAWRFIRYMVEEGALRIAATGNYPCYRPAYDDELISAFIEGSGLSVDDVRLLFGDLTSLDQQPTGAAAAEYQLSMQEQVPLFLNGEKSLEEVLSNIQRITDAAIAKEQ